MNRGEALKDMLSEALSRVHYAKDKAADGHWLVGYDVNAIQEYVTANSRPVAMRGASLLIKEFDEEQRQRGALFAGGGRGMLLVSQGEAEQLLTELPEQYATRTVTGVLAVAAVPWSPRAEGASLRWLKLKLQNAKGAARPPFDMRPDSKASQCARCRMYEVATSHDVGGETERVCARCDTITTHGRRHPGELGQGGLSLVDFATRGYVAAISADGNNMGRLFEALDTLESVASVSAAVQWLFGQAHEAALKAANSDRHVAPVTGGDDIRVFLRPGCVVGYVATLARKIEEGARDFGTLGGTLNSHQAELVRAIGVGVGVTVTDAKTSASWMLERAHELELSAKRRCLDGARSAVDFAWSSSGEAYLDSALARTQDTRDRRPVPLDGDSWESYVARARHLRALPAAARAVVAERRSMSEDEFANLFRYQSARSEPWQGWYRQIGSDWRDSRRVIEDMPDLGMLELVRMLEPA